MTVPQTQRFQARLEEQCVAGHVTMTCPFGERSEHESSAIPISWEWEERQRPPEIPVVSTARRLGERSEPRARDGCVEPRRKRECVRFVATSSDVTAVERNDGIAGVDDDGARLPRNVRPDDTRAIEPSAVRTEERPPATRATRIGTTRQLMAPRCKPRRDGRRKLRDRRTIRTVSPHDELIGRCTTPRRQPLSAKQWPQQRSVELTTARVASDHLDDVAASGGTPDDERGIATTLHTE